MLIKFLLLCFLLILPHRAFAAIAIDATANAVGTSAVITTTHSPDVIIFFSVGNVTTSISDTAGLTWIKRGPSVAGSNNLQEWYAIAPTTLTSDTITASGTTRAVAVAISGANTVSPFDPNISIPAFAALAVAGTSISVTVLTSNANDLLLTCIRNNSSLGTITEPSGFAPALSLGSTAQDVAFKIVSTTQASVTETYSYTTSARTDMSFDAIQQASTTTTQDLFFNAFP